MSTKPQNSIQEKALLQKIALLAGQINKQKNALKAPRYTSFSSTSKSFERPRFESFPIFRNRSLVLVKNKSPKPKLPFRLKGNKLIRNEVLNAKSPILKFSRRGAFRRTGALKGVHTYTLTPKKTSGYIPNKLTINGATFTKTSNGNSLVRSKFEPAKAIASQKLKQSLRVLQTKKKKDQYCLFFTKFGKCDKGDKCRFIHDKSKIAICRNFLRGSCNDPLCKLSHRIDADKMPVCSFFLKGICTNENCPYSHVYVNPEAALCPDFQKGYCPKGDKCKLRHLKQGKQKASEKGTQQSTSSATNDDGDDDPSDSDSDKESEDTSSLRPTFDF